MSELRELHDLFSDPKYFHCIRRSEWVRLDRCIGRQETNAQKKDPGTPAPFPVCVECEQGLWNRQFRGVWTDGTPKRGKGKRNAECQFYSACLNIAVKKDWRNWNCESCPYCLSGNKKTVEKPKNTRICEECRERTTISEKSPYCPVCMARKSNEVRSNKARKGKNTKKPKPRKGRKNAGHSKDKPEKSPPRGDEVVLRIDLAKYGAIWGQVKDLAEKEMRPVDVQAVYMIKKYLEGLQEMQ